MLSLGWNRAQFGSVLLLLLLVVVVVGAAATGGFSWLMELSAAVCCMQRSILCCDGFFSCSLMLCSVGHFCNCCGQWHAAVRIWLGSICSSTKGQQDVEAGNSMVEMGVIVFQLPALQQLLTSWSALDLEGTRAAADSTVCTGASTGAGLVKLPLGPRWSCPRTLTAGMRFGIVTRCVLPSPSVEVLEQLRGLLGPDISSKSLMSARHAPAKSQIH
jgi:hypothetical protein